MILATLKIANHRQVHSNSCHGARLGDEDAADRQSRPQNNASSEPIEVLRRHKTSRSFETWQTVCQEIHRSDSQILFLFRGYRRRYEARSARNLWDCVSPQSPLSCLLLDISSSEV